jgi:uncharacterized cupredoxin-like copper-binding protein
MDVLPPYISRLYDLGITMFKTLTFRITVVLLSCYLFSACGENIRTLDLSTSSSDLQFYPSSVRWSILPPSIATKFSRKVIGEFSNHSTHLSHRWVLIEGGDQEAATIVAAAATQSDYDPPSTAAVIAKTILLPPGRGQVFEFIARPGNYIYVCTVPGHYQAGMKGSLVLTE